MIGVGLPSRRKRTYDLIDSEPLEEIGDTMDTNLEIFDVFISDKTKEEVGELRDWCDEFNPSSSSELVGNRKQISDLHTFLKCCLSHSGSSILHLAGPPGCGKTTALRVLGRELGMDVVEWNAPTIILSNYETEEGKPPTFPDGQFRTFKRFLIQNNYPAVSSECSAVETPDHRHTLTKMQNTSVSEKKILLIKDIPNTFICTPSLMREVLALYQTRGRHVLVFVVSSSQDSSDPYWKLFSRDLLQEFGVASICFNAIHNTGMKKVISRVTSRKSSLVDDVLLDEVLDAAAGDLRFALNTLHFYLYSSSNLSFRSVLSKTKTKRMQSRSKSTSKQPDTQSFSSTKNHPLSSLHAIAKVLHSKRQPWTPDSTPAVLPPHLSHHTREQLQYQPDHVFDTSTLSNKLFLSYLHRNLPDYSVDMNELTTAYTYLSQSDILSPLSSRLDHTPSHYAPFVASIGISHSLTRCVSSRFRISGPIEKQVLTRIESNKIVLSEMARGSYQLERDHVRLATDLLSYPQLISSRDRRLQAMVNVYRFNQRGFVIQDALPLPPLSRPTRVTTVSLTSSNPSQEDDDSLIVEDFTD